MKTERAAALKDKVAVVTGANRGIGFAIAALFAREGARCVLIARDGRMGEHALKRLKEEGLEAQLQVADVTDSGAVNASAREVISCFATVDVLVNNAGVLFDEDRRTAPRAMEVPVVQRTLDVNLYGAMRASSAFLPAMRAGSRIINVSSTMGQLAGGSDGYAPAYSISKSALNAYTQALAADLRKDGIMVDCFHPGWAKTAMGGANATIDPQESAQTALFLASRPTTEETGLFWRGCRPIEW